MINLKERASSPKFITTTTAQNIKARKTIISNLKSSEAFRFPIRKQQKSKTNDGLSEAVSKERKPWKKSPIPTLAYLESIQNSVNTRSSIPTILTKTGMGRYRKKQPLWLGLSIGYSKSFQSLQATDMTQQELVDLQKAAIQTLDAYSLRLSIEQDTRSAFFWSAGLFVQQHTNRLTDDFTQTSTEIRPDQLLEIIRQSDGSEELIYGNGPVRVETKVQTTNYLRYQRFNLSLLSGIKIQLSKPLQLALAVGPAFAVQMRPRGKTIAGPESIGTYIELADLSYKTTGLWQAQASTELNFILNRTTQLSLGAIGGVDLNSIQQQSSGIKEKYQYLGFQLGLKKYLK